MCGLRKALLLLLFSSLLGASTVRAEVAIGILIDGSWGRNAQITVSFEREILELTGQDSVVLPRGKQVTSDWSVESVSRELDQLLTDPELDLIITGVLGPNEACHRGDLPKPVISPFVINSKLQNIRTFRSVVPFTQLAYL